MCPDTLVNTEDLEHSRYPCICTISVVGGTFEIITADGDLWAMKNLDTEVIEQHASFNGAIKSIRSKLKYDPFKKRVK